MAPVDPSLAVRAPETDEQVTFRRTFEPAARRAPAGRVRQHPAHATPTLKKCYQRSVTFSIDHWRSEGIMWAGENARRSSADGPVLGVRPWPTQ